MSKQLITGEFKREEDILQAVKSCRERAYKIVDVYTPYAVHGLDRAMGLTRSRLPWVAFLLGVVGAGFKVWFEFWTTGVDWPLNVGGKPFNSLPAFVPVTFEVMVLFAGIGTVLAFLVSRRLLPGKRAESPSSDVTSHRFAIILEATDAAFNTDEVIDMFNSLGAVRVEESVWEDGL